MFIFVLQINRLSVYSTQFSDRCYWSLAFDEIREFFKLEILRTIKRWVIKVTVFCVFLFRFELLFCLFVSILWFFFICWVFWGWGGGKGATYFYRGIIHFTGNITRTLSILFVLFVFSRTLKITLSLVQFAIHKPIWNKKKLLSSEQPHILWVNNYRWWSYSSDFLV